MVISKCTFTCVAMYMTCLHACTYRNKLVTDNPRPLTAPNLSGVTELLMNSA